jgi:hypothetical protein
MNKGELVPNQQNFDLWEKPPAVIGQSLGAISQGGK